MTVINKDVTFLICLVCILTSCFVTKPKSKCVLLQEKNTIYGVELDQKEFYIEKRFIPRNIENLLRLGKKPNIYYKHFSDKTPIKYCGYHIYGCRDTTWAKRTMADHLMKKYNIERFDSTYLKTIYRLDVVDENKIVKSADNCIITLGFRDNIGGILYNHSKCTKWPVLAIIALPPEYNKKTSYVEYDMREGNYDISVPLGIVEKEGLDYYSRMFLEPQGLSLSFVRIDTVQLGVYRYKERKYGK